MMLSTALSEMIDNTECVMFYNTPNAVSLVDDIKKIKEAKKKVTLSPWIYHELAMTSLIRNRRPSRIIPILENVIIHKSFSERNNINIEHDVDRYLEEMISVSPDTLKDWKNYYANLTHKIDGSSIPIITGYENIHPLDVLYNLLFFPE